MIFHIPMQLDRQHASASQIRPLKMISAFQSMGYQVDIVEGPAKMRQAQIRVIKQKIQSGTKYDFVYSESSTMPTLLTERHHLPTYPFLDFGFFHFCKKNNIPIGLFYRDIHWCFVNKNKDWKQCVARYFYQYDLKKYKELVDVLFLPSLEMLPHIPFRFDGKVVPLPPGGDLKNAARPDPTDTLNLLYVGGVGGNYDLRPLLKAVAQCPSVRLTVCCRPSDWQSVKDSYSVLLSPNVTVVHRTPEQLPAEYAAADLFTLFFHGGYWKFAVPFKLFEAVGYGIPMIAAEETWCGSFVQTNGIGQTVAWNENALVSVLQKIQQNPSVLKQYRERLAAIAPNNTWESRARTVADVLTKPKNA